MEEEMVGFTPCSFYGNGLYRIYLLNHHQQGKKASTETKNVKLEKSCPPICSSIMYILVVVGFCDKNSTRTGKFKIYVSIKRSEKIQLKRENFTFFTQFTMCFLWVGSVCMMYEGKQVYMYTEYILFFHYLQLKKFLFSSR